MQLNGVGLESFCEGHWDFATVAQVGMSSFGYRDCSSSRLSPDIPGTNVKSDQVYGAQCHAH